MKNIDYINEFISVYQMPIDVFEFKCGIEADTLKNAIENNRDVTQEDLKKISKRFSKKFMDVGFYFLSGKMFGNSDNIIIIDNLKSISG
jgi:hypothetical protein